MAAKVTTISEPNKDINLSTTSVGISLDPNRTFIYPYSLISCRKWSWLARY